MFPQIIQNLNDFALVTDKDGCELWMSGFSTAYG